MRKQNTQADLHKAIYGLEEKYPEHSIRLFLEKFSNANKATKLAFYATIAILLAIIIIYPKVSGLIIFTFLSILYLTVQLFKLALVVIGAINVKNSTKLRLPKDLPIYSILLPLYHENKVLEDLVSSIQKIDYPSHLLDVKLLIEEDDTQTLQALKKIKLPKFIETIKIPVSHPRTKPKACNYALQFAKGKYVTIYDAEDRPHPQQLKQVVAKFARAEREVICIQAKLGLYNKEENILTKLFALDYALLFDYVLVGLHKLGMPIPLGGTSNHFIREKLIALGGWDAFNVTEDADLGIRIYQHGYRTELIDSITLKEAPISLKGWIIQRSRWIKGHLLTSMIHLKGNNLSLKEKLGLHLILFMPNIAYPLLPFYVMLHFLLIDNEQLNLLWQLNIYLGGALSIGYSLLIIYTKKWYSFKSIAFASPFYYLLLSVAATRAALEIFKRPFHWDKTAHGVSRSSK
jgi:cellulose synthase/poly-beta-1,6-N-acetylglucosamine synthase-like glycosyltransferase